VPVNIIWTFAAVAVPFVATPGASTAVVLRNSVAGGVRSGVATALGVNAGSIVYGVLTAYGMAVALQRWPMVWTLLRVAGVGYLAWLGARSLLRAISAMPEGVDPRGPAAAAKPQPPASPPLARYAREGFLTNALNPSIATFYLLVLPHFIPRDAPFAESALLLTAVHVTLALSWHLTWAAAGGTLAGLLGRSRPRRILEGLTGAALLFLSLRLWLPPSGGT
jgi:threonine/homoserine/homoserine lactone efflux protein